VGSSILRPRLQGLGAPVGGIPVGPAAAHRLGARRVRVRRSGLDRFLDAGGSADPGTADDLESLGELLRAANHGGVRERVSALHALASAAEALAARLEASLRTGTGKVDDARR